TIMQEKAFGDAGNRVIIEEKLEGEEASLMAFCDSKNIVLMLVSQDHKQIFDNDEGPNTGGMGAYSPAPVMTEKIFISVKEKIFNNFVKGLAQENIDYRGVIYAGIMNTKDGPKVLEFNVRFGDPESQAVLPLLKTDLSKIILATIDRKLGDIKVEWEEKSCVCVVVASGGYPGKYEKGKEIFGLEKSAQLKDAIVFHAGTSVKEGKIVTSGGRVLGVTALDSNLKSAIDRAYQAVSLIKFEKMYYRKDIGKKGLKHVN
ncbi:unnamed protein product, partial [marine sediment metagenome]